LNLRPSGYEKISGKLRNQVKPKQNRAAVSVLTTKRRRMISAMVAAMSLVIVIWIALPQIFPILKREKWNFGDHNGKVPRLRS